MAFTFLYPQDTLCGELIRALEARNWKVPGLNLKFRVYGSGEQKMRFLALIEGEGFTVSFGGVQTLLPGGRWNDLAGFGWALIGGQEIREVLAKPVRELLTELLRGIEIHPRAAEIFPFEEDTQVPFPEGIGPLFCFGDADDMYRLQEPVENLKPSDRYGLEGNGLRLLSWGFSLGEGTPKEAHEGFLWCGFGDPTGVDIKSLVIPGYSRPYWEGLVLRVKPKTANRIFVADHSALEKHRDALDREIKAKARASRVWVDRDFTKAEVGDFWRARARTLIPITKYVPGSFDSPVVLIGRELSLDEVEIIA